MKAMLRFRNGDRQEIELDATQVRNGHPIETLRWQDGNDGVGGDRVGIRTFWLEVPAYRDHRLVRYVEAPR